MIDPRFPNKKLIPTLFQPEMVRAIHDDRKDLTRRTSGLNAINVNPSEWMAHSSSWNELKSGRKGFLFVNKRSGEQIMLRCPYGELGDILWVRENFAHRWHHAQPPYFYQADDVNKEISRSEFDGWKPSIHMPFSACRLWLEVVSIRVERLQDITEQDAVREGVSRYPRSPIYGYKNYRDETNFVLTARESFETLINSINGPGIWEKNPWMWRIEFKNVTPK